MSDDPARRRFMAVQAMRWAGVALVMAGLLALNGRIDLPREAGYILFIVGLAAAFVMPTVLARRWRSPPP